MRVTILGCGRWGSFLAWYLDSIGYEVLLWGRENSSKLKLLEATRQNDYVTLPGAVKLSTSLDHALLFSEDIVIAIAEQNLRQLMSEIVKYDYKQRNFILSMKGLENKTCKRLSEVVKKFVSVDAKIAVLAGPGHPKELVHGVPTCMIVDSLDDSLKMRIAKSFSSKLIRFHAGDDIIGNEIGTAAKNVIGIAGGMLDGLGYTSLKGALMVMGTSEIAKIIHTMGGNPMTAYGLACLGEYQASLFSEHSNSVNFGIAFVKEQRFGKHAPGFYTAQTIAVIAKECDLDIPLCNTINEVILGRASPIRIIDILLNNYCKG